MVTVTPVTCERLLCAWRSSSAWWERGVPVWPFDCRRNASSEGWPDLQPALLKAPPAPRLPRSFCWFANHIIHGRDPSTPGGGGTHVWHRARLRGEGAKRTVPQWLGEGMSPGEDGRSPGWDLVQGLSAGGTQGKETHSGAVGSLPQERHSFPLKGAEREGSASALQLSARERKTWVGFEEENENSNLKYLGLLRSFYH